MLKQEIISFHTKANTHKKGNATKEHLKKYFMHARNIRRKMRTILSSEIFECTLFSGLFELSILTKPQTISSAAFSLLYSPFLEAIDVRKVHIGEKSSVSFFARLISHILLLSSYIPLLVLFGIT